MFFALQLHCVFSRFYFDACTSTPSYSSTLNATTFVGATLYYYPATGTSGDAGSCNTLRGIYAGGGFCCGTDNHVGVGVACGTSPPPAVPLIWAGDALWYMLDPNNPDISLPFCLDTDSSGCTTLDCMSAMSACGNSNSVSLRNPKPQLWQWGSNALSLPDYYQLNHAPSGYCL